MKHRAATLLAGAALAAASPALAAPFDGSEPFICAVLQAQLCLTGNRCSPRTAQSLDVPQFLRISVAKKEITGTRPNNVPVDAKINAVNHLEKVLFLQGTEGDYGWSIAVGEEEGNMVLTLLDHKDAAVIFGDCTPR